jgi:hypothetical protein
MRSTVQASSLTTSHVTRREDRHDAELHRHAGNRYDHQGDVVEAAQELIYIYNMQSQVAPSGQMGRSTINVS